MFSYLSVVDKNTEKLSMNHLGLVFHLSCRSNEELLSVCLSVCLSLSVSLSLCLLVFQPVVSPLPSTTGKLAL